MRTFTDAAGRTWTVAVTVDAIKRVRDLLGEDLLDVERVFPRLMADPILLCDVVYCVCKPQADAEKISDVDFARAMAGQTIAQAKQALVEELIDFFPDPDQQEMLRLALSKQDELAKRVKEAIKTRLMNPKLPREIEAALSNVGNSSTS